MRISTGSRSVEIAAREMFPLAQLGFVHSACRRQFCGGDHLFLDSLRLGAELQKKTTTTITTTTEKTLLVKAPKRGDVPWGDSGFQMDKK